MTQEAITKLIELLRVFINTPCRTKTDAELLEAKLAEFEKEVIKPERHVYNYITRSVNGNDDARAYIDAMTQATAQGFKMESCGINGAGTECPLAWAILSKTEEE